MTTLSESQPVPETPIPAKPAVKLFGVGNAGVTVLSRLASDGLPGAAFVAIDTDAQTLAASAVPDQLLLEPKLLRGLGSGGDPERGQTAAEERFDDLKAACQGVNAALIVAGLGGGAGTGVSPVIARAARESGALVIAFVVTPFECEGSRRQRLAEEGLASLKEAADAVICLPNQKIFRLIDENTGVVETFKFSADLLADGVRSVWRLLVQKGLIEIHFPDLCEMIRDHHAENSFAVVEAMGPTRSRDASDRLLAHPMLEDGAALEKADIVLISLLGGPDMTMAEINRVMQQVGTRCEHAQVMMGAAVDETFRDRMVVTLIVSRKQPPLPEERTLSDGLDQQLLAEGSRPASRILPPPPAIAPEEAQRILTRQSGRGRARKPQSRLRQGQLPLEIISKGRFDKSEPTIHKGEDLDVPTYIRRGVSLN
jgi:cell division protein FtsZ